jgi:hypothetical protein
MTGLGHNHKSAKQNKTKQKTINIYFSYLGLDLRSISSVMIASLG